MLSRMVPSSPPAMRTFHLLKTPDILCANDSRLPVCYSSANRTRDSFGKLFRLCDDLIFDEYGANTCRRNWPQNRFLLLYIFVKTFKKSDVSNVTDTTLYPVDWLELLRMRLTSGPHCLPRLVF